MTETDRLNDISSNDDETTALFFKILDLYDYPQNYKEDDDGVAEITLVNVNGQIAAITEEGKNLPLGFKFDFNSLEGIVEWFKGNPFYSTKINKEESKMFIRMGNGTGPDE